MVVRKILRRPILAGEKYRVFSPLAFSPTFAQNHPFQLFSSTGVLCSNSKGSYHSFAHQSVKGVAHNISMTRPGNFPLCRAKAAEHEESKHCTPSSRPSPQGEGESAAASLKNLRRDWPDGQPIIWKRAKGVPSPRGRPEFNAKTPRRRDAKKNEKIELIFSFAPLFLCVFALKVFIAFVRRRRGQARVTT